MMEGTGTWGVVVFGVVTAAFLASLSIVPIAIASFLKRPPRALHTLAAWSIYGWFYCITKVFVGARYALLPAKRLLQPSIPPVVLRPVPSPVVPRSPTLKLSALRSVKRSFSFDGCSWLMVFHLGVATALVDRLGYDGIGHIHFCGASCGSLISAALVARVDMKAMRAFVFDMLDVALTRFMGPVGCMTQFVEEGLRRLVPADAYKRANGKLTISISALTPLPKNLRVSEFASNEDLIQACLASCYIPVYYETPRMFRGEVCVDGGLTDNQPRLDGGTATVSPFLPSRTTIRPETTYPASMCLFPGCREDLETIYNEGYNACVNYCVKEGLVTA